MGKIHIMQIKDARANLSKIINNIEKLKHYYVIGPRYSPKAVLIDIDSAKEYLPNFDLNAQVESEGAAFVKGFREYLKNSTAKEKKIENVSENIDKIVYGL